MNRPALLVALVVSSTARATEPALPSPVFTEVCATPRQPKETVEGWVKRGLQPLEKNEDPAWRMMLQLQCKEGTLQCASGPDLLRANARQACPLADAWEWGVVMGQSVQPGALGWVLRVEAASRSAGWQLSESKRLRELLASLGALPTRIVTTTCAREKKPDRLGCLLAEVSRALTMVELMKISSEMRVDDAWPAGKPEQGVLRASVHASCKVLAALSAKPGGALAVAQKTARDAGFSPVVAAALRAVENVPPERRRDIVNATGKDFGFSGECWPGESK